MGKQRKGKARESKATQGKKARSSEGKQGKTRENKGKPSHAVAGAFLCLPDWFAGHSKTRALRSLQESLQKWWNTFWARAKSMGLNLRFCLFDPWERLTCPLCMRASRSASQVCFEGSEQKKQKSLQFSALSIAGISGFAFLPSAPVWMRICALLFHQNVDALLYFLVSLRRQHNALGKQPFIATAPQDVACHGHQLSSDVDCVLPCARSFFCWPLSLAVQDGRGACFASAVAAAVAATTCQARSGSEPSRSGRESSVCGAGSQSPKVQSSTCCPSAGEGPLGHAKAGDDCFYTPRASPRMRCASPEWTPAGFLNAIKMSLGFRFACQRSLPSKARPQNKRCARGQHKCGVLFSGCDYPQGPAMVPPSVGILRTDRCWSCSQLRGQLRDNATQSSERQRRSFDLLRFGGQMSVQAALAAGT